MNLPPRRRFGGLFAGLVLVAACVSIYAPCLRAGFLWDDADIYVLENPFHRGGNPLVRIWCTTEAPDYIPVTYTFLWLQWLCWGTQPSGYHAVNIALHGAVVLLAWRTLEHWRVPGAWWAALGFAVHPVNVETVAWISQFKTLLATLFGLACLWIDTNRGRRRPWWQLPATAGLLVLALLSKPSVVGLPLILLGAGLWFRSSSVRSELARMLPLFGTTLAIAMVQVWFQRTRAIGDDVIQTASLSERAMQACSALAFYFGKAFDPSDLCFVYPPLDKDPSASLLTPLVGLVVLATLTRPKRSEWIGLIAGLGAYAILLAPALGLVDFYYRRYAPVADHYQYHGLIALAAVAAGTLFGGRLGPSRRALARLIATVLACLLGVMSARDVGVFASEESVWRDTLAKNPDAWLAHGNLVRILFAQGRRAEAMRHYEALQHLQHGTIEARFAAGIEALQRDDPERAEWHLLAVLEIDPIHPAANLALGELRIRQQRFAEARWHLANCLLLDPENDRVHALLADTERQDANLISTP